MKNTMKNRRLMRLITCIFALLIGVGVFGNCNFKPNNVQTATEPNSTNSEIVPNNNTETVPNNNQNTTEHAIAAPYDNPKSTDGVRIDGWRALRDMTALRFRPNVKSPLCSDFSRTN